MSTPENYAVRLTAEYNSLRGAIQGTVVEKGTFCGGFVIVTRVNISLR